MSLIIGSQSLLKSNENGDEYLAKQLTEIIRRNVPYSKQLQILGILSYTTDNGLERFIKINSSFKASCDGDRISNKDCEFPEAKYRRIDDKLSNHLALKKPNCTFSSENSPGASPPTLPPSVLHNTCSLDDGNINAKDSNEETIDRNSLISEIDYNDLNNLRRDRRKCRRPKRQVIDSESNNGDSDADDVGTDTEDNNNVVSKSSNIDLQESNNLNIHSQHSLEPDKTDSFYKNKVDTIGNININICSTPTDSLQPETETLSSSAQNNLSFVSLPYAALNKCINSQISSIDLPISTSNATGATKYAISAKSLGLGDFGELCGVLPINTLLNKAIITSPESNLTSRLLFTNNCSNNPAISINNSDVGNQVNLNQNSNSIITNTQTHNVLLNPNIAAAVAAVISNSIPNNSNSTTGYSTNLPNLSNLSATSIALTGPSGEILGTIPLASASSNQNFLSNTLSNSSINPSFSTTLSSVNVSLPVCANSVSSPGLTNTLNWLRCATNSTDSLAPQIYNNINNSAGNGTPTSINSNNPVALLQSLVTQQQQQQQSLLQQVPQNQSNKQQSSTLSVGPTLALIGTLGLNSSSIQNTNCVTTISESIPAAGNLTPQVTNLLNNNNINTNTNNTNSNIQINSNNGAALVAALLKSLTTVKQSNQEPNDLNTEVSTTNIPGTVTVITNNMVPSTRRNVGFDDSTSSFTNLINGKVSSNTNNSFTNSFLNASCANAVTRPVSNSLTSTCTQMTTTRNSIMLSYPRGNGEMNLLLTPASINSINSSPSITPLTAVPTALSFQGISTSQSTNLALTSPVLLHTTSTPMSQVANSISCPLSVTPHSAPLSNTVDSIASNKTNISTASDINSKTPTSNQVTTASDATASAIDKILQTIKGCMNASSNRAPDQKNKVILSNKKIETNSGIYTSLNKDDQIGLHEINGNKRHLATKITQPVALSMKINQNYPSDIKNIKSSKERVPIPSLHKTQTETNENNAPIPISKVYRCRYCGKTFNRKFCRERHERLHTGVKPYTCEICDEKFIRLEDKKRHVRSLQHYYPGRSFKNESLADRSENNLNSIEPSSALPLLAQTLQSNNNEIDNAQKKDESVNNSSTSSNYIVEHDSEMSEILNETTAIPALDTNSVTCTDADVENEPKPDLKQPDPTTDLLNSLRLTSKVHQANRTKC